MYMKDDPGILNFCFAYLAALLAGCLLLAAPGGRVTYFALVTGVCILFALHGSRAIRIWSVVTSLLTLVIVIWDHEAGMKFQQRLYHSLSKSIESKQKAAEKPPSEAN
jgi:hypothetical protein